MITMSPKTKQSGSELVWVKIPHGLCARIEVNRKITNLTLDEFVFDAISEKLASLHRERRKRKRL